METLRDWLRHPMTRELVRFGLIFGTIQLGADLARSIVRTETRRVIRAEREWLAAEIASEIGGHDA